jgi:short-subunit dehydrogenase
MNAIDKICNLSSRKAIVIGANDSIGNCAAPALASRGVAAALVGRNIGKL